MEGFEDKLLDPVTHVKEYIRRTEALRKILMMFVTLKVPYKAAQMMTVAGWLSKVIMLSGQKGTPGSTWSGASSRAIMRGADLSMVMGAGDWTSASVLKNHYLNQGRYLLQREFYPKIINR